MLVRVFNNTLSHSKPTNGVTITYNIDGIKKMNPNSTGVKLSFNKRKFNLKILIKFYFDLFYLQAEDEVVLMVQ